MLTNSDFANLLKTSASSTGEDGGKKKFDLNQVAQWDKQNDAKRAKKQHGKPRGSEEKNKLQGTKTDEEKNALKYRDRAKERRKDVQSGEDAALEAVVSRLDAAQTKFLGGDVEHTHLVKGLDYALLRKIRDQDHRLPDGSLYPAAEEQPEEKDESSQRLSALLSTATVTTMGANLKAFLLANPLDNHGSSSSGSGGGNPLTRLAFEFALGPGESEEQDIPTIISRSKQDLKSDGMEDCLRCVMSASLEQKLTAFFAHLSTASGGKNAKRKRKNDEAATSSSEAAVPAGSSVKKTTAAASPSRGGGDGGVVKMDIFEGLGKYVPVGALDDETPQVEGSSSSSSGNDNGISASGSVGASVAVTTVKDLFNTNPPTTSPTDKSKRSGGVSGGSSSSSSVKKNQFVSFDDDDDDDDDYGTSAKSTNGDGSMELATATGTKSSSTSSSSLAAGDDLMAPVRAILHAQAAKDKAAAAAKAVPAGAAPSSSAAADRSTNLMTNAHGKVVLYRDILGGSSGSGGVDSSSALPKHGEAMGHGSYEIYPETGTGYELESDEDYDEGGDDDAAQSVSKKAGSGKKTDKGSGGVAGVGATAATKPQSSGDRREGKKTSQGPNRAARRAGNGDN